jgi:hypothetical protein
VAAGISSCQAYRDKRVQDHNTDVKITTNNEEQEEQQHKCGAYIQTHREDDEWGDLRAKARVPPERAHPCTGAGNIKTNPLRFPV